jgi:hypothetical protein
MIERLVASFMINLSSLSETASRASPYQTAWRTPRSAAFKRGWYVQQGMKIGYVTDLFGKTVWEARAPSSGVVLYVCAVPSMKKGETVANIGVVAGKAP